MKQKINVVGIGPGAYEQMTIRAITALKESQVIIGYTVYVDLVKEYFPEARFLTTPMTKEVDRCQMAFAEAEAGQEVSMICSGDAGVYGMAGLIYEIGTSHPEIEIEVIPGVSAVLGGAALLGAPLIHDFCCISLSDRLTSWETIEKRLLAAEQGDLVICLYNPASRNRPDYLKKACQVLLACVEESRACGVVRQIGREGESSQVMTLRELRDYKADMFTTVFIGNSQTRIIGDRLVTPRGYQYE